MTTIIYCNFEVGLNHEFDSALIKKRDFSNINIKITYQQIRQKLGTFLEIFNPELTT